MRTTPLVLGAALLCAAVAPATAFNTLFLRDSAVSAMSDAEFELMTKTVYETLDNAEDGASVDWGDPSGAHGTITAKKHFEYSGYACRGAALKNNAGGYRGSSTLEFCKNAEGHWKILTR